MGGPVIETIRPGVQFAPDAAASFRRAEAGWLAKTGRLIDCNSSYRDYGLQLSMWQAWTAWVEGWGPKPNHSRALHPDASVHCQGRALDSDDWTTPGFIEHMAEHGWIRTAAWDPTERHHFEYQVDKDQRRYEPAPAGFIEEDDMFTDEDRALLRQHTAALDRLAKVLGGSVRGDGTVVGGNVIERLRTIDARAEAAVNQGKRLATVVGGSVDKDTGKVVGGNVVDRLRRVEDKASD